MDYEQSRHLLVDVGFMNVMITFLYKPLIFQSLPFSLQMNNAKVHDTKLSCKSHEDEMASL